MIPTLITESHIAEAKGRDGRVLPSDKAVSEPASFLVLSIGFSGKG